MDARNATVSIQAEIPEELYGALQDYLEGHPDWDIERVFAAALSLFLLQNGDSDHRASRVYLDTLFRHPAEERAS
jgi:predicted TPR repeat methyltransferase